MKFVYAILLTLLASALGYAQEKSASNRLEEICRKLDERRSAAELISADSHVVLIEPKGYIPKKMKTEWSSYFHPKTWSYSLIIIGSSI